MFSEEYRKRFRPDASFRPQPGFRPIPEAMQRGTPKRIELIARGLAMRDGSVLLCRSVSGGYAYLPGGHVEPGEASEDALVREFMEEAGLVVAAGPLLLAAEARFTQAGRPRHELTLVFHVEPTAADGWPSGVVSHEADISFAWIAMSRVQKEGVLPACIRDWLAGYDARNEGAGACAWRSSRE